MLARPDIKGSLAQSTVAQMGFMIMTCGFGAWAAAVLHLAAHGTYKASRFLNSGTAVAAVQRQGVDHRHEHAVGAGATIGVAVLAALPIVGTALLLGAKGTSALLLIFAWAALALAGRGWVAAQTPTRGLATFLPFAVIAGPLYVFVVEEFAHFVEPAVPAAAGPLPSALLLIPIAVLITAVALLWAYGPASLRARLYVWALTVGDGSRPPRSRRGTLSRPWSLTPRGASHDQVRRSLGACRLLADRRVAAVASRPAAQRGRARRPRGGDGPAPGPLRRPQPARRPRGSELRSGDRRRRARARRAGHAG